MNDVSLPDNERTVIQALARVEFGITDADEKRAHRVVKVAGALGWVGAGAAVAFVGYRWGGFAVFNFMLLLGPLWIGMIVHVIAKAVLTRRLRLKWSSYQTATEERIRAAAEAYKQEVMQTATFWQNLDRHTFEREFARLLREHGYHAEVTPGSSDGGVDMADYWVATQITLR